MIPLKVEWSSRIKRPFNGVVPLCFMLLCLCPLGPAQTGNGQTDRVGQLITALKDPDWKVRRDAAEELGKIKDSRAVEPLISAYKDGEDGVNRAATWSLGEIKDPRAVEPLSHVLIEWNWSSSVRSEAALALGKIQDPRAVEPLNTALKDPDPIVRRGAAEALGKIQDPRAIEPLNTALKDPDPTVRQGAAEALGKIKERRAVEPGMGARKSAASGGPVRGGPGVEKEQRTPRRRASQRHPE